MRNLFVGKTAGTFCREAHGIGLCNLTSSNVGGHNDNGIGEIHMATLSVSQTSFIQNLQKDIEDIGMSLFNLIKKQY